MNSSKFKNIRIIITGDHGFRSESTDPYMTLGTFKGFEEKSINFLRSPQDIASLILQSFNKK